MHDYILVTILGVSCNPFSLKISDLLGFVLNASNIRRISRERCHYESKAFDVWIVGQVLNGAIQVFSLHFKVLQDINFNLLKCSH